jgi:CheY-like chemotaxis protein
MVPRMLVIDDEEPILFALREYFTLLGYRVDCAGEPEEAEALLTDIPYAVVIVDLRLSGIESTEGLALIDTIRERCPKTGILLLTAYGNPSIEQEALSRGADAFLNKPMPLPDIAHIVTGLLGARPGARAGFRT